MECTHLLRLAVPSPPAALLVPPPWRAAKLARDGPDPPAHITLLTPAELKRAVAALAEAHGQSAGDARALLVRQAVKLRRAPWRALGLGVAAEAAPERVHAAAFLVVDWPAAQAFRRALGLPDADFHITLGFYGGDVHGTSPLARKQSDSLLLPPSGGWPRGQAGQAMGQAAVLERAAALAASLRPTDLT